MTIRPAVVGDAPAVHRTVLAAWRDTVDPRSSGHRLTEPEVVDLLAAGGGFVAESGVGPPIDMVVGSVLWAAEADTVELMKLAVVPAARGTGLGPSLVRAVEEVAAERGAARVLLAVSAYQPGLVTWYEGLGYEVAPGAVYLHASPHSPRPIVLTRGVATA